MSVETKLRAINTIRRIYNAVDPSKRDNNKKILNPEIFMSLNSTIEKIVGEIRKNHELSFNMVELLSTDLYTYTHSVNVTILSLMMSHELGYSEADQFKIGIGCLLHDIGKVLVDDEILHKREALSASEFRKMQKHSKDGYDMIKDNDSLTAISKNIVLLHHEKLDGSGYPYQLKGDEIKKHVRISTIADIFDAVTSDRVYSKELPRLQRVRISSFICPS